MIPGRDLRTLEQAGHYFLLFPNPAHARAYQSHVVHLHRVAKMHTPTSVESPLPLQPGVLVEGEGVHSLLQDYALYPPSQRMSLKILDSPHTASIQSLLQENGYRQLVEGEAKTGRSVLLWVDGRRLTTNLIRNSVAADGRDRGLAWNFSIERVKNHQDTINTGEENEPSNDDGGAELKPWRHAPQRWILSFTDENEARRFVRMWHRKPFPTAEEDGLRLVHAEFLW